MKSFGYQNSRGLNKKRILRVGAQPISRTTFSFLLHYLLIVASAILVFSCIEEPVIDSSPQEKPSEPFNIILDVNLECDLSKIKTLDILIYDAKGLKELETQAHIESDIKTNYKLSCREGDKIVVLVANSPRSLKKASVLKYETCLGLEFEYSEMMVEYPLMTGVSEAIYSQPSVLSSTITNLDPCISWVRVSEITNNLDNYELLENPRLRLRKLNSSILAFKKPPYYPNDYIEEIEPVYLPFDIGMEAQSPGIILSCFPNSYSTLGLSTELEFECEIMGKTENFNISLPAMERGATFDLKIYINGPEDYKYEISQ